MYKKIIAATLIALQSTMPAFAAVMDAKYYYRKTQDVIQTSAPAEEVPTDIPEVSVGTLRGSAGLSSVESESPASVLGSIANLLQGGVAGVVFDGYSPSIGGLSLNASGQIVGTPTSAYSGTVYVSYHDGGKQTGRIKVPVSIFPRPALTSSKAAYTVPENGDTAAYGIEVYPANDGFYDGVTYSLAPSSAPLPAGLSLSGGSIVGQIGDLGGTSHVVTIRGTSPNNPEVFADRSVTLNVVDVLPMALDLKPDTPLKWALDEQAGKLAYAEKFAGKPTPIGSFKKPLTWSIASGPSWLALDADNYLKGVPDATGDFEATIMVEDADGQIASDRVKINVAASGYVFLSPSTQEISMRIGESIASAAPTVSNAKGAVTFSAEEGNLGKLLRLDTATGVVTGTTSDAGPQWVHLHVKDSQGRTDANGALPDTRYGVKLNAVAPIYISGATVKKISGVANASRRPIVIKWGKAFNVIGTAKYSILGNLPGTVWIKYYDNNDFSQLATYVNDAGSAVRQIAGETTAQTTARLGADPFVFDTATMTLQGVSPIVGGFNVYLNVHDSHAEEGYKVNPADTGKTSFENYTTPGVRVFASESVMDPVNSVDEQYLAAYSGQANVTTQILDSKTGAQWGGGGTNVYWTLVSGSLPPGVTTAVYQSGRARTYTGFPTTPGTYELVWAIEDTNGITAETVPVKFVVGPREALSYSVNGAQQITVAAGVDTVDVQITPLNRAENKAVTWTYTGALPAGVAQSVISASNVFRLYGVPTQVGTYSVTAKAVDAAGASISVPVEIKVETGLAAFNNGGSAATIDRLGSGPSFQTEVRDRASWSLYTGNGLSWALKSGTVPPGLTATWNANKSALTYQGSATQVGTYSNIVWTVSAPGGVTFDTEPVTITVRERTAVTLVSDAGSSQSLLAYRQAANLTVSPTALPSGVTMTNYTVQGNLPTGVTYAKVGNTLKFSGTPTSVGDYQNIVVTGTDSDGGTATITLAFVTTLPYSLVSGGGSLNQTVALQTVQPTLGFNVRYKDSNDEYAAGITWTYTGTLPPGVALGANANGSSVSFSGYPTQTGTWSNIVLKATDTHGNVTETSPISITVNARAALTLAATPSASRNLLAGTTDAGLTVTATNRALGQAVTWEVEGVLPTGITYAESADKLVFSGKATTPGAYTGIVVTATDSLGATQNIAVSFTVAGGFYTQLVGGDTATVTQYGSKPTISVKARDAASSASKTNVTWRLASGTLPPGITGAANPADLSSLVYSGIATQQGTWSGIVWAAVDTYGNEVLSAPQTIVVSAPAAFSLTVSPSLTRTMAVSIDDANTVVKGVNPANGQAVTWSVSGNLPAGVTSATVGGDLKFSGKSNVIGNYPNIIVTGTDSVGRTATANLTFVVSNTATQFRLMTWVNSNTPVTATTLTQGTQNANIAFDARWAAGQPQNGVYNVGLTWTLQSGRLPEGLVISYSGVNNQVMNIKGYAKEVGVFPFTFVATNPAGQQVETALLTVTVNATAMTITAPLTKSIRSPDSENINATGGNVITVTNHAEGLPVTWSYSTLPAGISVATTANTLTFNGKTALTVAQGTYVVEVTATDAYDREKTTTMTITTTPRVGQRSDVPVLTGTAVTAKTAGGFDIVWLPGTTKAPYRIKKVQLISGNLPAGFVYDGPNADGLNGVADIFTYGGVATETGTFNPVWRLTDDYGYVSEVTQKIVINPRAVLTLAGSPPATLSSGVTSGAFSVTTTNTPFGNNTMTWEVTGSLPYGVTYATTATQVNFSGTPKTPGTYTVNVKGTDSKGGVANRTITYNVTSAFYIAPNGGTNVTFANGIKTERIKVGKTSTSGFNTRNNAGDGYHSVTWTRSGTLPPGVTFSNVGGDAGFGGTATTAGTYGPIIWDVKGANGQTVSTEPLVIIVEP